MDFHPQILKSLFLLCLFSLFGWVLESVYRSVYARKFINPGFLFGPYLPIYGITSLFCYLSLTGLQELGVPMLIRVFMAGSIITLMELLVGLYFLTLFKIRLWDYSDSKYNFMGLITLRYSIYWALIVLFYEVFFSGWLPLLLERLVAYPGSDYILLFSLLLLLADSTLKYTLTIIKNFKAAPANA